MAKTVNLELERWMMPRDRQVIVSVYRHGMLNSKQIEYIHFRDNKNSKVIALRRLKKLVEGGYLMQHWFGWTQYGTMQHFTITDKGAMIVALSTDLEPSEIKIFGKEDIKNVEHTILIGNFHIGLLKSGYEVEDFKVDHLNRFQFSYKLEKLSLEPDGVGVIHSPSSGKTYPFLMEMDRGGMKYDKLKDKILKYEAFYLSNHYKKEFDSFPIVIFVTTTEHRLNRLKQIAEKESKTPINYLFTTINNINNLSDYTLHLAGHTKKVAL